jgi:DNA replication ATP-dependent helicase Dna2
MQIGDLVKDWRRMNVSFTRARSKLIIFGSRKTLQVVPLLNEFFTLMDAQNWIFSLPAKADEMHCILHTSTTTSPSKRAAEDTDAPAGKQGLTTTQGPGRPLKKSKTQDALSRGRPILKDLLNNEW